MALRNTVMVVLSSCSGDKFAEKPSLKLVQDAKGQENKVINIYPEGCLANPRGTEMTLSFGS